MKVLFLGKKDVSRLLTMEACISLMKKALRARAKGQADQPLRNALKIPGQSGLLGMMPAYSKADNQLGIKIVTVFPDNHEKGLPSHMGVVLLFDGVTGKLLSIQDGEEITAIRTAAASAVATDLLANDDASRLAILGAGVQGYQHVRAICEVRSISQINIWSRNLEHAEKLASQITGQNNVDIVAHNTVEDAVKRADIICTTTSASEPILKRSMLEHGAHINAVGACTPNARELSSDLVKNSKLFTDCIESIENEAGDYLIPLQEGNIEKDHVIGEIGDLLEGRILGRSHSDEITIFESLGIGVEDLTVADYLYKEAIDQSVGQNLIL